MACIQSARGRYLQLAQNEETPGTVVEINVQRRPEPVNAYTKHGLSELEPDNRYAQDVLDGMGEEIRRRAQNTLLWVSLLQDWA
ncbi:hypothetical protein CNMCM5623_009215 [Aspergillus felis]|uniref:Uncharacterized protein n=1 Tax=Aspergillus felis TaxID=1287682 RepID=A0A8H6QJZ7_9EURO|nr:hypothetical protein CNMCM5623_009215 [Aspergillus felis]KAF7175246.1 hypothetical protein CNMCM7691_007286 [Aspergillus felis]